MDSVGRNCSYIAIFPLHSDIPNLAAAVSVSQCRDIAHHDLLSTEDWAVSSEQRGSVPSRALGPYWDMVRR